MGKILIVEDDETIRNGLMIMLTIQGYIVDCAVDGKDAVEKFDDSYNLVVMDVLMPRMSGIDACRKMRDISNVPILFLTAKSSEIDKIQGFDAGADDYIIKPFSNMELIARIKALIRRREIYDQKHMDEKLMNESVECCGVKVYINQNKVEVDGKSVNLTRKESEILKLLIRYPDKVFTTENIYESVWGDMYTSISGNTIMVHVKNLRSKLSKVCGDIVIATVWGRGYKFER